MLEDKSTVVRSAAEIIGEVNNREIGTTCYREIELFLGQFKKSLISPSRRIKIRTLRITKGNVSTTFFCAVEPYSFKNISFLLTEQKNSYLPFSINLYIPHGAKLIRNLAEQRRYDEIFGSDFTYNDLKTWLYVDSTCYFAKEDSENRCDERIIENITSRGYLTSSVNYTSFQLFIDATHDLINKQLFFKDGILSKTLEYKNYVPDNDILIQREMVMTNYEARHETTIVLNACWHNRPIEEDLLNSEDFSKICQYIHAIKV